jgi:hypothetical protein
LLIRAVRAAFGRLSVFLQRATRFHEGSWALEKPK